MSAGAPNAILASLFAGAPSPSRSPVSSYGHTNNHQQQRTTPQQQRPRLAHSKSVTHEYSPASPIPTGVAATPRSYRNNVQKRPPRRVTSMAAFAPSSPSSFSAGARASPRNGGGSVSPFAGSKFSDSPAARDIPLPPIDWYTKDDLPEMPSYPARADSNSSSSSSSSSDTESLASDLSSVGSASLQMAGLRITPLQLIAAAASA